MDYKLDRHFCLDDSPEFRMVELGEVTSTNDFLRNYRPVGPERRLTLVTAEYQTAGRGAGSNRWESQPGQNLLFSLLLHPRHIPADRMFVLSEVLSLAIQASLNPPMRGDFARSNGRDAYKTASPDRYKLLKEFAKENRQYPTEAENAMWEILKNKNLGVSFRRQHIIGDYIVDFVCLQHNLIVEIDGGYHKHSEQKECDADRTASLQRMGFRVIRFTNEEIIGNTQNVCRTLQVALQPSPIMGGDGGGLQIKWPNDIYWGDRKICGMLIENELRGDRIERSVMGVGININQTEFTFDRTQQDGLRRMAEPVSLVQIVGEEVERRFVLERVVENFTHYYEWTEQGRLDELHEMYLDQLYRRGEKHTFRDKDGEFVGTIVDVEPAGHLIIVDETGRKRSYGFKEVEYKLRIKN